MCIKKEKTKSSKFNLLLIPLHHHFIKKNLVGKYCLNLHMSICASRVSSFSPHSHHIRIQRIIFITLYNIIILSSHYKIINNLNYAGKTA